jgi:hypothetical protein
MKACDRGWEGENGGNGDVGERSKKRGLVIANFAIRSPVPRSALFLK